MEGFLKSLSLAPRGIRHKLTAAFALMSVIPMLVCGYLIIYYIFPTIDDLGDVSLLFFITILLMFLGFYLSKKIIYPIIQIAAHAKEIAEGKLDEQLSLEEEDEIGELSGSLNRLSTRLKTNMSELHSYGEKIKQINMEINKKVFALSSLLQVGNLITSSADLNGILNLIIEKLSQLEMAGSAFLMFLNEETGELTIRAQANIDLERAEQTKIKVGQGLLGKVFESAHELVIDSQKKPPAMDEQLQQLLQAKNIAVLPITSAGKVVAILGMANNIENFLFTDDEIELIGVFAKQVSVAVENDLLMSKTEELTVRDELTGLYNENYIHNRLDEEIKRAISYQRPCSFAIFEIDNFEQYRNSEGEIATEKTLKKIAQTLNEATSEIDKTARFSDHQFAVVFPEKNKKQAFNLAENIRKEIERYGHNQNSLKARAVALTLSAGISSTPIDGRTATELINKSLEYKEKAKREGKNRVVLG